MDPDKWDLQHRWREQIERRLNQIGSLVKGNQDFHADRICDVMEQIEELRQELAKVKERQDKIADYVRANVPKRKKLEAGGEG
jgi:50S ribosomal subunit-associated GTPase HflX